MKSKYPIQVIDLRHQLDHITPNDIQWFEDCRNDPAIARLFVSLLRYWQNEMISDGKKVHKLKLYNKWQYLI